MLTEPNEQLITTREYSVHHPYLLATLNRVVLIDTNRISPDKTVPPILCFVISACNLPNSLQSGGQVAGCWKRVAIADDCIVEM
jgi:hypothetical protein